jgi:hypothetical protein
MAMPSKQPRYPIYIPSKGRAYRPLTIKRLQEMGIDFYVVIEPPDAESYAPLVKPHQLLVLPFADLGQGSIPARNWIWDHAISLGAQRHWVIDDNILRFYRLNRNRRIPTTSAAIFRAAEDFTDRYSNVALSGFNNIAFASDRDPKIAPFVLNTRVYSMSLIDSHLPYRWRGRYNEDTDLCLRALKDGWSTIQFNVFLGDKATTLTMRGGNTDTVYNTGDQRLEFAESLQRQHPDCVKVTWKFNRWHHEVDYSRFKCNALKLKPGVTPVAGNNEYGMTLRRVTPKQSDE